MFLQYGQMSRNRVRISTYQRPAKRRRRTEARVVCQSLPDDGEALAASVLTREAGGTSRFFERHQERQQQRRGQSGPRVVRGFARRGQCKTLTSQLADDLP